MKIELLYFEGCPNHREARALLQRTLRSEGVQDPILDVSIRDESAAQARHFLGSPSIHIDGEDIEEGRRDDPPLYGCRLYRWDPSHRGLPPESLIREAIRRGRRQATS